MQESGMFLNLERLADENERLKKENKELKEENRKLKEHIKTLTKQVWEEDYRRDRF